MAEFKEQQAELVKKIGTNVETGLSTSEVEKSREKHGKNAFATVKPPSMLQKILNTLKDVATIILIIAAIISFITNIVSGHGDYFEGILILGIVVINSVLAIYQEGKAEESLSALQDMNRSSARVLRNGQQETIDAEDVVVGDILVINNGVAIQADARLLEATELRIEESALTGESEPVQKDADFITQDDVPLGDRKNMVYKGTTTVNGRGLAIVTGVGMQTEMGKIAGLLNDELHQTTPLQQRLNLLGKQISIVAIFAALLTFGIGIWQGEALLDIFMTSVALAVAAVPETLMIIVTVTLAFGVQRMAKRHAIIRRLPAVETLGTASVIASDKTGTLTQNKMTVRQVWSTEDDTITVPGEDLSESGEVVLRRGGLSTDVTKTDDKFEGLPTEVALVNALETFQSRDALVEEWPRVFDIPFNSTRKRMTTVHETPEGYVAITKGAFDVLMPLVTHGDKQRAEAVNSEFGEQAMRVITITQKRFTDMPDELTPEFLEDGLELIGLVGIIDPPRPESRDAVERARQAGIKTVMITGDHVVTASAIAREIGILQDGDKALTGAELQQMSDDELDANVKSYAVYARVTPEDKIRIVKSWQRQNQVVAMTGDGVNDAPALKAANAGIAMGQTGTDVAREASDIILTDDNFATIVDAVEQGRGIYANIRKTINFLLSANISEILTIVIAIIVGWGSPVVAVHLLFINLVADGLPGFALSREPSHDNVMDEKPIKKGSSVFANGLAKRIAFNASGFAALTLFAYWFGQNVSVGGVTASHEVGQTMAFLGLSLASTWHVFNIRSERSLFSIPYSANRTLVNMVFLAVGITILVALVPFTQDLLYLTPISWIHWALSIGLSLLPVLVYEIVKFTWKKQGKVA